MDHEEANEIKNLQEILGPVKSAKPETETDATNKDVSPYRLPDNRPSCIRRHCVDARFLYVLRLAAD